MTHQQTEANVWEGAEVISTYSRAQAIEDGVLVDISDIAQEAGFKFPVAVSQGVWAVLEPSKELEAEGQDWVGRAWDMLAILRHAIRREIETDAIYFAPLFTRQTGHPAQAVEFWAKCGPGDEGETVITVMLRGED